MKLSADHEYRRSAPETGAFDKEPVAILSRRPKVEASESEAMPVSAPVLPSQHAAEDGKPPFPLAEPGEYYVGLWSGLPNYGCPYCGYATLDGSGAVELHILSKIDQGNRKHLVALDTK